MNLEEGIAQDGEMRKRFLSAIDGHHQMDPKLVAKVDVCMLGNWLHGEGERRYPFLKSFNPCVEAHDVFHHESEKVARQIALGEFEQAKAMLGNGTPLTKAFIAMVAAVRALKTEAKL